MTRLTRMACKIIDTSQCRPFLPIIDSHIYAPVSGCPWPCYLTTPDPLNSLACTFFTFFACRRIWRSTQYSLHRHSSSNTSSVAPSIWLTVLTVLACGLVNRSDTYAVVLPGTFFVHSNLTNGEFHAFKTIRTGQ